MLLGLVAEPMKLAAYMIVRNELDRYLTPCIHSLLEYCDEVCVWDDASTDGSREMLEGLERVFVSGSKQPEFDAHEGRARQRALDWAMKRRPTHILAIDADEFVADGQMLRDAMGDQRKMIWTLTMEEVWKARPNELVTREDGGWRHHEVPISYMFPWGQSRTRRPVWQIQNKAMACGRVPVEVARQRHSAPSGTSILHFGWANEHDRAGRFSRYREIDGGKFHRNAHLDSIMWPDSRIAQRSRAWPESLVPYKAALLDRANRG